MTFDLEPWPDDIAAVCGEQPDPLVSSAALADLLGIGPARLATLARQNVIPRTASGQFPLRASIRSYCKHLRETKTVSNPELQAARARSANAAAAKAELAVSKARGELLDASRVRSEWTRTLLDLRASLLGVPQRVAASAGLDRRATAALDAEIREVLAALADG